MRSIQDVGLEILGDNPKKFYVFCGTEYGIKCRYIDHLKEYYKGRILESDSVNGVLDSMKVKQLIKIPDSLYVVRYDNDFIDSLDAKTASMISSTNITGTIVCVYEDEKQVKKLDKFLPEYTVSIDEVNEKFVKKYLSEDFPKLSDRLINLSVKIGRNYGHAKQVAYNMSCVDESEFDKLSDIEIFNIFGMSNTEDDDKMMKYVASRNFNGLCNMINEGLKSYDDIIYMIMNTVIELDKIKSNKYVDSKIKEYDNLWTTSDIYYMYNYCYEVLKQTRVSSSDAYNLVIYLISLLKFERIPDSMEV